MHAADDRELSVRPVETLVEVVHRQTWREGGGQAEESQRRTPQEAIMLCVTLRKKATLTLG